MTPPLIYLSDRETHTNSMERANTTILMQPRGIYIKYGEKCHINVFDRTSEGCIDVHLYPYLEWQSFPSLNQHSSTAKNTPCSPSH